MSGVMAVFKSYPTLGDHAVFLALLSLHSQVFECKSDPSGLSMVSTVRVQVC
jgi:hypothetical protein